MNFKSIVYFSLFGLTCFNVNAQKSTDELLRINSIPFTVGEFERIYTKNLDLIKDEQQKDIDNYLDLFVLYKLKVAKAYDLELDKDKNHLSEFSTHRAQLAEQYLTNEETLNSLTKEAYDRSKFEIKAAHIIFLVNEFSTPADTLKAYNKAMDVRAKISNGQNFGEAAKMYSEDPNAVNNFGDLGYFSVLRMVYPFETGAYNTPVGEVSLPIRSQFGYHLIHVEDKRLRQGKRNIAHIFIEEKEDAEPGLAKNKVDNVYNELQNGSPFESLVSQYSEDNTSKENGGAFRSYEPGTINMNGLDDVVFQLKNVGDYSKPFKSQYGWHIVKLTSSEPFPLFDESKDFLIRKVQSDSRSRIINEKLVLYLKEKYNFKENETNYKQYVKSVEKKVLDLDWKPDNNTKTAKVLATFANEKITTIDFSNSLLSNQAQLLNIQPLSAAIKSNFNNLVDAKIKKYYNDNLENEFPEFKSTAQEFKEGLLLFDLMDKEIWQKAKNDTIGQLNYYQENLKNFTEKESIKGKIIQSDKKGAIKKALKSEITNFGKNENALAALIDKKQITEIKGSFTKSDKQLPKNYVLKEGVSEIFEENGKFYIVVADLYTPEKILDIEEAKQNVIYQYQEEFENHWLLDLKNNADVKINNETLKQLKAKYKQN